MVACVEDGEEIIVLYKYCSIMTFRRNDHYKEKKLVRSLVITCKMPSFVQLI